MRSVILRSYISARHGLFADSTNPQPLVLSPMAIGDEKKREVAGLPPALPSVNGVPLASRTHGLHASVYIAWWIALSSGLILFNKWILHTAGFQYPLFLTTWHLAFATLMTQIMARCTSTLNSRKSVPMTPALYVRAILPIGVFFSLSLIAGNVTYLYLSVSFIQMLKATNSVATLIATWALGVAPLRLKTLGNVSVIVAGVIIASLGEVQFVWIGVICILRTHLHPLAQSLTRMQIRLPPSYSSPFGWSWFSVYSVLPSSRWTRWFRSTTLHQPVPSSTESLPCLSRFLT
jgi:hypothetical protein